MTTLPATKHFLGGIPNVQKFITWAGGTPIPIYLSEALTGILVDQESRSLNINQDREQSSSIAGGEKQTQRGVSNSIVINLQAKKNSSLLSIFMAFADVIFSKAVENKARFSYFHGSTVINNGWLTAVSISQTADSELLDVSLTIEKPLPEVYNKGVIGQLSSSGRGEFPSGL